MVDEADFTRDGLLLEVVQGDVAPHITVEVDQDGVETRDAVKQLGDIVVRFNLGGVRGSTGWPREVTNSSLNWCQSTSG
ncbi:Uncharacterised protein [Leclercia adecarboxylata]|uniref:Uncharacterized protein n=1 Tax=Leclercia adecarboxylata TaxID=83655 RepID=A0A4U9HR67_9ENTR|nr:Uncharacterised protein [Leclercia adecarboxylata]